MTEFISAIRGFFIKTPKVNEDPVYRFFYETSSRKRKTIYNKALKNAQIDQEAVAEKAKEMARV